MKWIKCTEKMPDTDDLVLLWGHGVGYVLACYSDSIWQGGTGPGELRYQVYEKNFTHWMPLPEEPDAPEIEGEPTDTDRLNHVYGLIHNTYCPNNEYMTESPELHYDYSCEFILGLINKRENNSGDTP